MRSRKQEIAVRGEQRDKIDPALLAQLLLAIASQEVGPPDEPEDIGQEAVARMEPRS